MRGLADLDLHGRMPDSEAIMQLAREPGEKRIARSTVGHDKMTGERGFGGAHGPDVEIVHTRDSGQFLEIAAHVRGFDFVRHTLKRERERIPQQAPSAPDDYGGDGET